MKRPTVSLCVTAYNEKIRGNYKWLKECVAPAVASDFVSEIVVVNDGTPDFPKLAAALVGTPKLRIAQNPSRLHVFGNKLESVWQATSDWVLMCDSDNVMPSDYYDKLAGQLPWVHDTWYSASFARPTFDYRDFIGRWRADELVNAVPLNPSMFWCMVNTGNQFVHRATFLSLFGHLRGKRFDLEQPDYCGAGDRSDEKWFLAYGANDSFFMFKEWLLAGHSVHCVDKLEYSHRMGNSQTSNYERGPIEKSKIPAAYFMELLDFVRGEKHEYVVCELHDGITILSRDDGNIIYLNHANGIPLAG